MDMTAIFTQLFLDIKEWIQPALRDLQSRVEKHDQRYIDVTKRFDELLAANALLVSKDEVAELLREIREWQPPKFEISDGELDIIVQRAVARIPAPEKGEKGDPGEPGKSVTPDELQAIEARLLSAIPEPIRGEKGDPGASVTAEDLRPLIVEELAKLPKAKDGRDGVDGRDGANGRDGADGRDALQLEILPSIDFDKSYPRGTYAMRDGGLFRSYQRTQGQHGWECVVAGVRDFDIDFEDERTLVVRASTTDHQTVTKRYQLPSLVYRGVYSNKRAYLRGDVVTCAGSLWHAQVDAPAHKPGVARPDGEKHWQLCVKKGTDGRSAS